MLPMNFTDSVGKNILDNVENTKIKGEILQTVSYDRPRLKELFSDHPCDRHQEEVA